MVSLGLGVTLMVTGVLATLVRVAAEPPPLQYPEWEAFVLQHWVALGPVLMILGLVVCAVTVIARSQEQEAA